MMQKNRDLTSVVKQKLCNSCGACFAACSRSAISYTETVGGYIFPAINQSLCNNCGLCYKVCPGVHFRDTLEKQMPEDPFIGRIENTFIGKSNDEEIYRNSQSGGIVTALLIHLLETKQIDAAVVSIMKSATPPRGEVILANNRADLIKAQKSKYTPIPVLKAIRKISSSDCRVALVGLSCHMHGLYNLCDLYPSLEKKVTVKIGLICDRTLTAAAVDFLAHNTSEKKICNITFRDKNKPSYPGNVVLHTVNNRDYVLDARRRMEIKDFFTPARCTICFDKMNVFSDITVGDPHGIKDADRINGESLVINRSDIGTTVLKSAIEHDALTLREVSCKKAVAGQKIDQKKITWQSRAAFWESHLDDVPEYFDILKRDHNKKTEAKAVVQNAFKLDTFQNREKLLYFYRKKLFLKNVKESSVRVFRKMKNVCLKKIQ